MQPVIGRNIAIHVPQTQQNRPSKVFGSDIAVLIGSGPGVDGVVSRQATARGVSWRSVTTARLRHVGNRDMLCESKVIMSPRSTPELARPLPSDCGAATAASTAFGLPPVVCLLGRVH